VKKIVQKRQSKQSPRRRAVGKHRPASWLIQSLGKSFSWLPLGGFGRIKRRMSEFRRKNSRFVQNRPPDHGTAKAQGP
jgi:hypothetical protein